MSAACPKYLFKVTDPSFAALRGFWHCYSKASPPKATFNKLSIWPPSGTVLTGEMHGDLNLIQAFK